MLKPRPTMQVISYKDYNTGKGVPKTDSGLDNGEAEYDRLEKLYREKQKRQLELIGEMEQWLESVEDSEMRAILRHYYRDGLSQREIGERMKFERSAVARKIKRFWIKCQTFHPKSML